MKRLYIAENNGTGAAPYKIVGKDAIGAEAWVPEAELDAVKTERDRVAAINVKHCESVNTLLVDGARLEDRAEAAEARVAELEQAAYAKGLEEAIAILQGMRATPGVLHQPTINLAVSALAISATKARALAQEDTDDRA
jgi:hypothetical protein